MPRPIDGLRAALNGAQQQESVREAVGNAITTLLDVSGELPVAQRQAHQGLGETIERLRRALYKLDAARSSGHLLPDDVRPTIWGTGR